MVGSEERAGHEAWLAPELRMARLEFLPASEEALVAAHERAADDRRLDEAELESFPASDPHADWAGA